MDLRWIERNEVWVLQKNVMHMEVINGEPTPVYTWTDVPEVEE